MAGYAIRFLFHFVAEVVFVYSIYYDVYKVVLPPEFLKETVSFAGRWKYLTFITGVFHMVYYVLSALDDLLARKHTGGPLWKFRNYMFSCAVFPLGMFVATSFWSIYAIDRELILPKAMDSWFPSWLNHALHTSIVPFDLIETFLIPHVYPKRKSGLTVLSLIMVAYTLWILFIAFHTQYWVYPILAVFDWTQRAFFIVGCVATASAFYLMGETLNSAIWGKGNGSAAQAKVPQKIPRSKLN